MFTADKERPRQMRVLETGALEISRAQRSCNLSFPASRVASALLIPLPAAGPSRLAKKGTGKFSVPSDGSKGKRAELVRATNEKKRTARERGRPRRGAKEGGGQRARGFFVWSWDGRVENDKNPSDDDTWWPRDENRCVGGGRTLVVWIKLLE